MLLCLCLATAVLMTGCASGKGMCTGKPCKKPDGGNGGGGQPGAGQAPPGAGNHNADNGRGRPLAPVRDAGLGPGNGNPNFDENPLNPGDGPLGPGDGNPDENPDPNNPQDPNNPNPGEEPSPGRNPSATDGVDESPSPTPRGKEGTTLATCQSADDESAQRVAYERAAAIAGGKDDLRADFTKDLKEQTPAERNAVLACLTALHASAPADDPDKRKAFAGLIKSVLDEGGDPNTMIRLVNDDGKRLAVPLAMVAMEKDSAELFNEVAKADDFDPFFVGEGQTETLLFAAVNNRNLDILKTLLAKRDGQPTPNAELGVTHDALNQAIMFSVPPTPESESAVGLAMANLLVDGLPRKDPVLSARLALTSAPMPSPEDRLAGVADPEDPNDPFTKLLKKLKEKLRDEDPAPPEA